MIKAIDRPESKDVSIVSDSFLVAEIERIPSVRTVGQEHPMTRPETNETLREFNRDTRGFCVGLLGILFLAAWACLVTERSRRRDISTPNARPSLHPSAKDVPWPARVVAHDFDEVNQ